MAAGTTPRYKFVNPIPNSINNSAKPDQLYRDVEIPDFSVDDYVLWTPGGKFFPRPPEFSTSSNYGVGSIHRIVHYVHPTTHAEHILAFVYFYEWVPDSVELTWPDGDRYYRLLLPVSDLRSLSSDPAEVKQSSESPLKLGSETLPVVLRPCNLATKVAFSHPMVPKNSTIFNIHKKRGVKGIVTGFFKSEGNIYMEADFELDVYPDELTHSGLCDTQSSGCDYKLAINLGNLSQHFWDTEFKLLVQNKKVGFQDLFIQPEPLLTTPVNSKQNFQQKPRIIIDPPCPRPMADIVQRQPKPTPNIEHNFCANVIPSPSPQKPVASTNGVPSIDKNPKNLSGLMRELGSKLTLRKKKTSSKKEIPENFKVLQNLAIEPSFVKPFPTYNTLPRNTQYVGEYYNDFSETGNAENPPTTKLQSKFSTLPRSSETKPKALKPSFRSNKSYPAPPPPLPSSGPPPSPQIIHSLKTTETIQSTTKPLPPTPNSIKILPPKIISQPPAPPPPPPALPSPSLKVNSIPKQNPSRSNLLQEIRSGKSLRHVETDDRSEGVGGGSNIRKTKPPPMASNDFASIMMGALANRRAMIEHDSDSDKNSDSDAEGRNDSRNQNDNNTDHDNGWD